MKPVVAFFLYLCFYLLGGFSYAHGAPRYKDGYPLAQHNKKTQPAGNAVAHPRSQAAGLLEGRNIIISIDDEEEDLARKLMVRARYVAIFSYAFILICLCKSLKKQLSFGRYLSHTDTNKLIVLGSLRI